MGQDWMRWVRKVGAPCTRGLKMVDVHKKALTKFRRAMEYHYEKMQCKLVWASLNNDPVFYPRVLHACFVLYFQIDLLVSLARLL